MSVTGLEARTYHALVEGADYMAIETEDNLFNVKLIFISYLN